MWQFKLKFDVGIFYLLKHEYRINSIVVYNNNNFLKQKFKQV